MRTLGLVLLGVGGLLMLAKKKVGTSFLSPGSDAPAGSSKGSCPLVLDDDAQADRAAALMAAWKKEGVPLLLQLALIANAMRESKMKLAVRSTTGLPDDAKGGAWTAFQILKPNVLDAASRLGLTWSDVVPPEEPSGAEMRRFASAQARVCMATVSLMGHTWSSSDPERSALDLYSRWAAGPSWTWSRVEDNADYKRITGGRLASDEGTMEAQMDEMRAAGMTIAPGAYAKLLWFRKLRGQCGV